MLDAVTLDGVVEQLAAFVGHLLADIVDYFMQLFLAYGFDDRTDELLPMHAVQVFGSFAHALQVTPGVPAIKQKR